MANGWFETVAEAQRRAKKKLPASVYRALIAGAEHGVTFHDNVGAYDELGFAPHIADLVAQRDQSTTVMGQAISLPVLISPTGVQAVHPDGETAVARAAAARGTAMGLSSFASKPIEEVVAANPQTFFQVYWCGTRDQIQQRLDRAMRAGAVGLIVTLDWSFSHGRDWGTASGCRRRRPRGKTCAGCASSGTVPWRLRSKTLSQSASPSSWRRTKGTLNAISPPRLVTTPSIPPSAARVSATARSTDSPTRTSPASATARDAPAARASSAAASAASWLTSMTATAAPALAVAMVMACPTPPPPPPTMSSL
jgi:hypothetical protein